MGLLDHSTLCLLAWPVLGYPPISPCWAVITLSQTAPIFTLSRYNFTNHYIDTSFRIFPGRKAFPQSGIIAMDLPEQGTSSSVSTSPPSSREPSRCYISCLELGKQVTKLTQAVAQAEQEANTASAKMPLSYLISSQEVRENPLVGCAVGATFGFLVSNGIGAAVGCAILAADPLAVAMKRAAIEEVRRLVDTMEKGVAELCLSDATPTNSDLAHATDNSAPDRQKS